jgi:alpha-beta hydrolase superfamily lysophospholipase
VPVLIVPSEKEEWVPSSVDVPGMIERWKSFAKPGIVSELGGLIPGANHRVDNDQGQECLSDRVARFLRDIETRP